MTTYSAADIALFKQRVGLWLEAYQDPDGVWAIGYGHTKGVKAGDICSVAQAEKWLEEDLKAAFAAYSIIHQPIDKTRWDEIAAASLKEEGRG